ncbi:MAG: YegS/Rv2252/BmrU family lipid kinase [Sphingobacteriales bacterium]|nr:MAG: YegS/Rv2252/BmrU family lipid kinase [Sphingobacteriales bacterium]
MKKHLVFVINPRSGVDRQKAIQQAIDDCLDHNQYSYELQFTQYARHGTALAAQAAAANAWAVVAVGGDGSVNDVAKGLVGTPTALAIVPKGSGNGMARSLGIPLNERLAISLMNAGHSIMMDMGYANEMSFISNAGVGFDTLISKKFAASTSRGFKAYSWLVTRHLWNYKCETWKITADGESFTESAFMITVANGRQFGYNFKIAPGASWTDGLFDLVIVKRFPKIMGGSLVWRAMNGSITKSPYVRHLQAKDIVIEHPNLQFMQTDGDAHPTTSPVHFRMHARALKVIVAP